jgi:uncharacterized protein (TIGR03032 family)
MPDTSQTVSPALEIRASRQFMSWMHEQNTSLAFSTYQAGKLFLIGTKPDGNLSVFERTFNRCMGLVASGNSLYTSSLYQIWRLENLLAAGEQYEGHDRLYIPQLSWITGDLDVHDLGLTASNDLVFVNTLFSCLARVSERYSFEPIWQPTFISKLAAEDRCHLNGLAMKEGEPAYVTAISRSDVAEGWRDRRHQGGIVVDVNTHEIITDGLSMPHSPRWYQGTLWVLNSGTGWFGKVDLNTGKFEPLCFCPGYARGLSFTGDFALIGLSKPRGQSFSGLALDDALKQHDAEARCGIIVVNLRTGDLVHSLSVTGVIDELFDVVTLPSIRRPAAVGLVNDDIRRMISIPPTD